MTGCLMYVLLNLFPVEPFYACFSLFSGEAMPDIPLSRCTVPSH